MLLGTKSRYAVMAMVELAGRVHNKPVTLADLAQTQEITVPYLEQIFSKLKNKALVKSVRGPGGGYVLARTADKIRISDVIEAVDESMQMTRCENHHKGGHGSKGCMSAGSRCLTHDLWDGLEKQIYNYLHSITLADVCARSLKYDFMAASPVSPAGTNVHN